MSTVSTQNPQNLYSTENKDSLYFDPDKIILCSFPCVATSRDKATKISLLDMALDFSNELKSKPIGQYRGTANKAKKAKFKITEFKAFTISIGFDGKPTGILTIDIDHVREKYNKTPHEIINLICQFFPVLVGATSIGGDGVFILMRYPKENNLVSVFKAIAEDFDFIIGLEIDFLADLQRLRIDTFDPDVYINWGAGIYERVLFEEETPAPAETQKDSFSLNEFSSAPATAFNNSGLAGLEVVNEVFENLSYTITAGKKPTIYEYQRANGALKSIVAFYNKDVVLFQVFSPNTGLKKEHYNLFDIYTELNNFDLYTSQKELAGLGFGEFKESSKNPFPIEVFPPLFREFAIDLNKAVNFPIDYTATALLTATATAAGTKFKALVKSGWIEYGSLFTCLIGNAGANKTHPVNTLFAPIKAIDKQKHQNFQFEYDLYCSYEKLSKKDKETIEGVIIPTLEKSVLSNFTTEILFKRLSENPRGCTVLSDELISFLEGMNNYSKSDQIGLYLSIWSNQPTTIDRISNPVPLFLSNPYLSIIGGLQPRALNKAFPVDKLNNGFFQRLLFAYPDSSLKAPINDNIVNEQLANDYERFINRLFEIDEPRTLTFSPAAKRYFYEWQANNCDKVNDHQNSIKGEIISKFDNHFIRLALLVEIMTDPESKEIEIEAVEAAKLLCDYYLKCSFKVLAKIQNTENYLLSLPTEKQQLFNELEQRFTTLEATEAGLDLGIAERTIKRFLQDTQLFKKIKHGNYEKLKFENQ